MRAKTLSAVLLLAASMLAAQVEFGGLDLAPDNRLVFGATVELPDYGAYSTLFLADVATRNIRQLTFFPERVTLAGAELQIENRFGVFRTRGGLREVVPMAEFPSFVAGGQIETGRLAPIEPSPDGRFIVFVRPTSVAHGDLILHDVQTGSQSLLAGGVELALERSPALWSPDSQWFVYSAAGQLYYYSIAQHRDGQLVDAAYRRVAKGKITSARWASPGTLYYIDGDLVYRIGSREFFTKSFYTGLVPMGGIVGKLPFTFDTNFDAFWISPDGTQMLLQKGGRNLFLLSLHSTDYSGSEARTVPYLHLPRSARLRKVEWPSAGGPLLLLETGSMGRREMNLYRASLPSGQSKGGFERLADSGVRDLALAPDGDRIAVVKASAVAIKNSATWTTVREIEATEPLAALWLEPSQLVIAGRWTIVRTDVAQAATTLVCLAQARSFGFAPDLKGIVAEAGGRTWILPTETPAQVRPSSAESAGPSPAAGWQAATGTKARQPEVASAQYRVYVELSTRGSYRNLVMVRDARGFGTVPLFPPERVAYEPIPTEAEPVDFMVFNHGSRVAGRQVALVFDVMDSIEGLPVILETLHRYGIRATFFVSGEAIRRYPDAAVEIAASGHEVGSLFFANIDTTDTHHRIDGDFIKLGLAHTEDLYFAATGRELALLWHAPYYSTRSDLVQAARELNYTYVGRDVDSLDWVGRDDPTPARHLYQPASQLVERIIEKKRPGSIIPILAGAPAGYREDFLFQRLDLLINALIAKGYRIVPVSVLMESSR